MILVSRTLLVVQMYKIERLNQIASSTSNFNRGRLALSLLIQNLIVKLKLSGSLPTSIKNKVLDECSSGGHKRN